MSQVSLKRRFLTSITLIYLIAVLLSIGGLGWIIEGIASGMGRELAEKQSLYSRSQSAGPLQREEALARKMADSPLLHQWAKDEHNPDLRRQALAELNSYRRSFRDGSVFFVLHESGNYYFNDAQGQYTGHELRYTLDPNKTADAWYYATLKVGYDYQVNVNPDDHLKVTKVWINVIMREGDHVLGVLGTGIDLSAFIRTIIDVGQNGITNILIDSNGAIQAHRDTSLIDYASLTRETPTDFSMYRLLSDEDSRRALRQAMGRLQSHPDGVETCFLRVNGKRQMAGVTYIPDIRWFVVTLIDLDVVTRQNQFLMVAGLFALSLLVCIVVIAVLLDRLVLSRVARLDALVRRFASGETALDWGHPSGDELGRLTTSFATMAGTVQDYTETLEKTVDQRTRSLTSMARELQRSNAELEQFAYIASHDLREPLRTIASYIQLIERRLEQGKTDELQTFFAFAVKGAKRMDAMIRDLLEYSRIGRMDGPMTPVALDDVINEVRHDLSARIAESQAEVRCETSFPVLYGDRHQFVRLFLNLLGNAIKYAHPGRLPVVRLRCDDVDGQWRFSIRDNGIGIEADQTVRIFGIFQRLVRQDQYEGTGIGLAVCKKIVERYGGQINAEPAPDVGSVFYVTLPKPQGSPGTDGPVCWLGPGEPSTAAGRPDGDRNPWAMQDLRVKPAAVRVAADAGSPRTQEGV